MTKKTSLKSGLITLTVTFFLSVLVIEGISRVIMVHWRDYDSARFMRMVEVEGYNRVVTGLPGFDDYFAQKDGDFRAKITINAFGLRNKEPIEAANGRVWAVGDSITFGWGVGNQEMFSAVMARQLGETVYNVASPGTSVCGYQALLARMPKSVRPKAIVIGLLMENDVLNYTDCRALAKKPPASEKPSLLNVKKWLTRYSALYNFLAVSLKQLAPIRALLIKAGLVSQPHIIEANFGDKEIESRVNKTVKELKVLREILPEKTPIAILIVPSRSELRDNSAEFKKMRQKISQDLKAEGFQIIDPFEALKAKGFTPTHFLHDGHWTVLGHEVAGTAAAAWVR